MMTKKRSAEKTVRDIRRATRRKYSAEEKIRVVLEVLRGEDSIAGLCRREGITSNVYYRWSKEFLEAAISFDINAPPFALLKINTSNQTLTILSRVKNSAFLKGEKMVDLVQTMECLKN